MRSLIGGLLLLALCAVGWAAEPAKAGDPKLQQARTLFESHIRLSHAFDSKVADLYSDQAVIRNRRVYSAERVRETEMPGAQYKQLMRTVMPLAKLRGDYSTYSQVSYAPEGDGVRIRATRFSKLKKYSSPFSMLVKPTDGGPWRIVEEISESRP